ncbi:MAG: 7-cyano-7-deazaguanine synthase QueC [bacterium]|nr:7-cyano-7-deazaguanine synthase QueC [bacterium]
MKDLAIVLVSGGIDSCVTAAITNKEYELAFLHINYGQRTQTRELKAFNDIANFYKVKHRLICELEHFKRIGGSSLIDLQMEVPIADSNYEGRSGDLPLLIPAKIPSTYVPFRNANLLAVAVSWAEVIGVHKIFIGVVEEDTPGYPDCRKEFYEIFNKVIKIGTKPDSHIEIVTPIIGLHKYEVIKKGIELNAPIHLTWSCYREQKLACGNCDSCIRRLRAFKLAGISDPISYA